MPLQLIPAADESQVVPLDKAIVLFGRHPDCDVVITSSRKVSRKHCCIAQVNNEYLIRDLGSMNGVFINGTPTRGAVRIGVGDEVGVGDVLFTVKEVGRPVKRATASRQPTAPRSGKPAAPPPMISQDVPVVIPDESRSFVVEDSVRESLREKQEPVVLSEADIIDSDDQIEIID